MTTWVLHLDTVEGDERNAAERATLGHLLGMAMAGWNISVLKRGGTVAKITEAEP
jgi:hypothetical protein